MSALNLSSVNHERQNDVAIVGIADFGHAIAYLHKKYINFYKFYFSPLWTLSNLSRNTNTCVFCLKAFSLPVIQIVHENLINQKGGGKKEADVPDIKGVL